MKNGFVALMGAAFLWGLCFHANSEAKTLRGLASYYKSGRRTASGELFNPMGYTAAHRWLPFGTMVQVTNLKTGKSVTVRINDRGPFAGGRLIDLSYGAALACGLNKSGVAKVQLVYQDRRTGGTGHLELVQYRPHSWTDR